jgi:hypothetical protein
MGLTKGKVVLHMCWQMGVNYKTKSQTLAKTCFAPCQVMGQHGTCWIFTVTLCSLLLRVFACS